MFLIRFFHGDVKQLTSMIMFVQARLSWKLLVLTVMGPIRQQSPMRQASPADGGEASAMSKTFREVQVMQAAVQMHVFRAPQEQKTLQSSLKRCGILSSLDQQRGFHVIPIDCPRNRHTPKCRLVVLDLTTAYEQLLQRIVEDNHVPRVHIFRAAHAQVRGIPMADGSPGQPPLRDANHLHGLKGLRPLQAVAIPT